MGHLYANPLGFAFLALVFIVLWLSLCPLLPFYIIFILVLPLVLSNFLFVDIR